MLAFKKAAANLTLAAASVALAGHAGAERVSSMPHAGEFFDGANSLGFSTAIHAIATPEKCTIDIKIKETESGLQRVDSRMTLDGGQGFSYFPFKYSMTWVSIDEDGKVMAPEADIMEYRDVPGRADIMPDQINIMLDPKISEGAKGVAETVLKYEAKDMFQYTKKYCDDVRAGVHPEFNLYAVYDFGHLSDEGLSKPAVPASPSGKVSSAAPGG